MKVLDEVRVAKAIETNCDFDVLKINNFIFVCIGNSDGDVFIFRFNTKETNLIKDNKHLITKLIPPKKLEGIRGCVFARDCKSILIAGDAGCLWRWEYVSQEKIDEFKQKSKKRKRK